MEAKNQIELLLSPLYQRVSVVSPAGNAPDTKYLELEKLDVYESEAYALMNIGAIPNFMSKSLCERLWLTTEESNC